MDKLGVRVNCICPGWVETEAVQRALATMTPEEIEQQFRLTKCGFGV
jgi:NAD(P)-dependent dehydrogenase (short-subunit alcohol dehydrogenase family)